MLANLFELLDQRPVKREGGFCLPYTVVLEHGVITQAYRVLGEAASNVSADNANGTGNSMAEKEQGRDLVERPGTHQSTRSTSSSPDVFLGCLKKEYDLQMSTIQIHLNLEEEATVFASDVGNRRRRRQNTPVKAQFVERLQRKEYAFDGHHSYTLHMEYFTDRYVHNILRRGNPGKDPYNEDAQEVYQELMEEAARKYRGKVSAKDRLKKDGDELFDPEGKSGLLQAIVPPMGDYNEIIRVVFYSTSPKGGSFPDHASCQITSRRNVYPFTSTQQFGYERMCTYDGPKLLTDDTTSELTEETKARVIKATKFVLAAIADGVKKYVALAVFMFKLSQDGQLYLTFAPHLALHGGDGTRLGQLPVFKIPQQYLCSLRRPKPTSALSSEEELLSIPTLDFTGELSFFVNEKREGEAQEKGEKEERKAEEQYLEDIIAGRQPRKKHLHHQLQASPVSSPIRSRAGGVSRLGIDYDKLLSAVENRFEDEIPTVELDRLAAARRDMYLEAVQDEEQAQEQRRLRKKLTSRCPCHPRENPQASLDALRRRHQCTTVNNVRSLLSVLEGRRGLSKRLADSFSLTKKQQKFLKEGAKRPKSTQHSDSLKSPLRDERQLDEGKERFAIRWSVGEQGFSSGPPLRERPKVGRPPPVAKSKLAPIWTTRDGKRPVFKPKQDRKQYIKELVQKQREEERLAQEEAEARKYRRYTHPGAQQEDEDHMPSLTKTGGESGEEEDYFPPKPPSPEDGTASVQSRSLDFPELIGFLPKERHDHDFSGVGETELERLVHGTPSTTLSGKALFEDRCDRMDREIKGHLRRQANITVEDRLDYMLNHPTYSGEYLVANYPTPTTEEEQRRLDTLKGKVDLIGDQCKQAIEYLYILGYHLHSRALASRAKGPLAPHDETPSRLLFSVPPKSFGLYEKRLVALLNSMPFFEQMNSEENIGELQLLIAEYKAAASRAAEKEGTTGSAKSVQAESLSDALFSSHLDPGCSIAVTPTFALKFSPPKFEFQSQVTSFALTTARYVYLEKMEELADEFNLPMFADGRDRSQSPGFGLATPQAMTPVVTPRH